MNKVEIYIDTDGAEVLNLQRLELFKDEEINITRSIKNSKDLSKVFTDYTQDFNVPASKHNKKVFKFVENSDLVGGVSISKKFKGEIRNNGETFKKGYFVFRDAVFTMGKVTSYKIYFVGGLGRLKTALGEAKIGSLDYSTFGVDVIQNYESVRLGLAIDKDVVTSGGLDVTDADSYPSLLYSLIMTEGGYYYSEDFTEPAIADYPKNLCYADPAVPVPPAVRGLAYNNIKPSLRMNTIIRAIENDSLFFTDGQQIQFSKDFFNNVTNKQWFDLFMVMHNKKGSVKTTEDSGKSLISGWAETTTQAAADTDGVNIAFSDRTNNPIDISSGGIVITENPNILNIGKKVRAITYTFTPSVNDVSYEIFQKNPFDTSDDLQTVTGGTTQAEKEVILEFPAPTFEATNGAKGYIFKLYAKADEPVTINCSIKIDWRNTGTTDDCEFTTSLTLGGEQNINPNTLLPDMKIMDFLKGAFSMFNLIGYEDNDGTIVVDTYDSYRSVGNNVDITKYVDDKSVNMSLKMPYNNIILNYKESEFKNYSTRSVETVGTSMSSAFAISGNNVGIFGQGKIGSSVDSADGSFGVKLPFQLMQYSRLRHSTTEAASDNTFDLTTQIQIGELVDFDDKEKDAKGIIYYPIIRNQSSATTDVNYGIGLNTGSATREINTFNIPSNTLTLHNPLVPNSETQSLWFDRGQSAWSRNTVGSGLYTNYHYNYLEPFFIARNRRLKLTSYLPSYILQSISLRDTIIYKGKEYRINSVKTNMQSGKSNFELEGFVTEDKAILLPPSNGARPVITILGDNPITVDYNSTYTDGGATAYDEEDGDITADLTDDSASIDTSLLSRQTVTYTVTDSDFNTTEAERVVIIEDTAIPTITTWSTNNINQATGEVTMSFAAASTGTDVVRCDFYVVKQGETPPTTYYERQFTDSGTTSWFGQIGSTYTVWMIAYNASNSVQSSDVTVIIIPL